jgi:predicted RNA-binding Zn-ribbon protein involved in translation (DUF1610 family)
MNDRKYRHRGYQDDDRDDERERKPRRTDDRDRRFVDGAPRGRGVGLPTAVTFKCAVCGAELRDITIDTDTLCPQCGKPLRTCTNCTFFDTSNRFECRKPLEQRVESKSKANTCEFFQPKQIRDLKSAVREMPSDGGGSQEAPPNDARAAFDALFKK